MYVNFFYYEDNDISIAYVDLLLILKTSAALPWNDLYSQPANFGLIFVGTYLPTKDGSMLAKFLRIRNLSRQMSTYKKTYLGKIFRHYILMKIISICLFL